MPTTSIALQPRDLHILHDLFDCRIMTLRQIAIIHFHGRFEAAKKRLQRLRNEGLLAVRTPRARGPAVHVLTRDGFDVLCAHSILDKTHGLQWDVIHKRQRISNASIPHELAIMDCKAAMHTFVNGRQDLTLAEFSTRPLLFQFTTLRPGGWDRVLVKPDGFMRLQQNHSIRQSREHRFFLEIDRSTESLTTLLHKLLCYREYSREERVKQSSGTNTSRKSPYPFRVLLVLKSAERRELIIAKLHELQPPINTLVLPIVMAQADAFLDQLFPR